MHARWQHLIPSLFRHTLSFVDIPTTHSIIDSIEVFLVFRIRLIQSSSIILSSPPRCIISQPLPIKSGEILVLEKSGVVRDAAYRRHPSVRQSRLSEWMRSHSNLPSFLLISPDRQHHPVLGTRSSVLYYPSRHTHVIRHTSRHGTLPSRHEGMIG